MTALKLGRVALLGMLAAFAMAHAPQAAADTVCKSVAKFDPDNAIG